MGGNKQSRAKKWRDSILVHLTALPIQRFFGQPASQGKELCPTCRQLIMVLFTATGLRKQAP